MEKKRAKSAVRKKHSKCTCANKEKQYTKEPPKFRVQDLMWIYYSIKMINEVFADPEAKRKILESRKDGPDNLFELAVLQSTMKIPLRRRTTLSAAARPASGNKKPAAAAPPAGKK